MIWRLLVLLATIGSLMAFGSFLMLTRTCSYATTPDLQRLIDQTKAGHTIVIPPGQYYANLVITKPLRIIAGGYATTIGFPSYDGSPGLGNCLVLAYKEPPPGTQPVLLTPTSPEHPGIEIRAEGVEIRGLRIRGGSEGIRVKNTRNVRLVKNRITNTARAGISLQGAQEVAVLGNEIAQSPVGLLIENSQRTTLYGNRVRGNTRGIVLQSSRGNRLARNVVEASGELGVLLQNSNENELVENAIARNPYGLKIVTSTRNALRGNRWKLNEKPLRLEGASPEYFVHTIETNNTIDGRPVLYLVNQRNVKVTARHRPAYLALVRSEGVVVEGVALPPGSQGILLIETQKSVLRNVVVPRAEVGIYAWNSRENRIEGVRIEQPETDGIRLENAHGNRIVRSVVVGAQRYGVLLVRSEGNALLENQIRESREAGIYLKESRKAQLEDNRLQGNWVGVYLERGGAHSIIRNWIRGSQFGIFLQGSSGSVFAENRLENNRHDANVATLPKAPQPPPPPSKTEKPSSKGGS